MFARNLGKLQAKGKLFMIHLPKGNLLFNILIYFSSLSLVLSEYLSKT